MISSLFQKEMKRINQIKLYVNLSSYLIPGYGTNLLSTFLCFFFVSFHFILSLKVHTYTLHVCICSFKFQECFDLSCWLDWTVDHGEAQFKFQDCFDLSFLTEKTVGKIPFE
jgi:hypothetical protein